MSQCTKRVRILFLGLVGGFTSEVLSSAQEVLDFFLGNFGVGIVIYIASFAILQDLVSRFRLNTPLKLVFLGMSYGMMMETFLVKSHFEPVDEAFLEGWKVLGVHWDSVIFILFWQGFCSVALTFFIVDAIMPATAREMMLSGIEYAASGLILAVIYAWFFFTEGPMPALIPLLLALALWAVISIPLLAWIQAAMTLSPAASIRSRGRILASVITLLLFTPLGFINPFYESPLLRVAGIAVLLLLITVAGFKEPRPVGARSPR